MNLFNIGAIEVKPLTTGHESAVSTVVVQVSGIASASGSMVPQLHVSMEGQDLTPPAWVNCTYLNQATGATVAAGTAITADGIYEFSTNGCLLGMNVTAVTGSYQCYVTPLAGPSGINGGGGGGSGGAVTIANGADVALGSTTDAVVTTPSASAATAISLLKGIDQGVNTAPTTPLAIQIEDATGTNVAVVTPANTSPVSANPALVISHRRGTPVATQVTVASTQTSLIAANTARKSFTVKNNGTAPLWIGPTGVTISTGFQVDPGGAWSDDLSTIQWFGIVTSTSQNASVVEIA